MRRLETGRGEGARGDAHATKGCWAQKGRRGSVGGGGEGQRAFERWRESRRWCGRSRNINEDKHGGWLVRLAGVQIRLHSRSERAASQTHGQNAAPPQPDSWPAS